MDALTHAALIGTARAAKDTLATATPVDALVAALGEVERERALLLQAGALAIYREAGLVPALRTDPLPDPAPDETLRLCSPEAAAVVQVLLKHHPELLPEALDRMINHGLR
ncbi:MAG: hypothetical protein H0X24_24345, partial [Ktedonobacterales bacterium]|nr:hypothetical protein [Ktedonobacterales bacterium]